MFIIEVGIFQLGQCIHFIVCVYHYMLTRLHNEMPDLCNPVHLGICVLTVFFAREVKEPCNRFIFTINKSFPRVKRERGRKEKKKKAFELVIDEVALFDFKDL